jgi:hypothetical protein
MRQLALSVLLVALLPLCAAAQAGRDSAQFARVSPAVGIHYGVPMKLSVSAGGLFDLRGKRNDGMIAMIEQGLGGTELSIGYFLRHRFGQGYSLRAAGIRTLEKPWNASSRTTYLGGEAHWMLIAGAGGRIGFFRRVSGTSSEGLQSNLLTVGLSIGD